jgi:hypothetical protein
VPDNVIVPDELIVCEVSFVFTFSPVLPVLKVMPVTVPYVIGVFDIAVMRPYVSTVSDGMFVVFPYGPAVRPEMVAKSTITSPEFGEADIRPFVPVTFLTPRFLTVIV